MENGSDLQLCTLVLGSARKDNASSSRHSVKRKDRPQSQRMSRQETSPVRTVLWLPRCPLDMDCDIGSPACRTLQQPVSRNLDNHTLTKLACTCVERQTPLPHKISYVGLSRGPNSAVLIERAISLFGRVGNHNKCISSPRQAVGRHGAQRDLTGATMR